MGSCGLVQWYANLKPEICCFVPASAYVFTFSYFFAKIRDFPDRRFAGRDRSVCDCP